MSSTPSVVDSLIEALSLSPRPSGVRIAPAVRRPDASQVRPVVTVRLGGVEWTLGLELAREVRRELRVAADALGSRDLHAVRGRLARACATAMSWASREQVS